MSDKAKYIAILVGSEIDLKLLSHCFTEEMCRVSYSALPDVGAGEFYFLESTELSFEPAWERKTLTKADDREEEVRLDRNWETARDCAERLLNTMHGAARLVRSQYKPVSLGSMHKFDLNGGWLGSAANGSWGDDRWRNYGMPPNTTGLTELVREWVIRGSNDEAVAFALSIYGTLPISWTMLYMVYEVVRDDVNDNFSNLISQKDLKEFTKAANNARDLRNGPRHAFQTALDESVLITLSEAEIIIRHILNHWLGEKVGKVMR